MTTIVICLAIVVIFLPIIGSAFKESHREGRLPKIGRSKPKISRAPVVQSREEELDLDF